MQKEVSPRLSDCSRGWESRGESIMSTLLPTHSPTQQGAFCSDPVLSAGWEWWCIQRWVSYQGGDDGPELLGLPLSLCLSKMYKETLNAPLECGRFLWNFTVTYKCLDLNRIQVQETTGVNHPKNSRDYNPTYTAFRRQDWVSFSLFKQTLKSCLRNCISLYYQTARLYPRCIFKRAFMAPPGVLRMHQAVNPWRTDQWA